MGSIPRHPKRDSLRVLLVGGSPEARLAGWLEGLRAEGAARLREGGPD